jgi:hypothetical protein
VENNNISDLEALAQLTDYAASLTPTNPTFFIESLGAVLTGHSEGRSGVNEFLAQLHLFERHKYYSSAYALGQTGYAPIFQDPDISKGGGNQAHHYWYYVQVGYESGEIIGSLGVLSHETFFTRNLAGNSYEDLYLGYEGVSLGTDLSAGTVNPVEVGDIIRQNLSPGSQTANQWTEIHNALMRMFVNYPGYPWK